MPSRPNDPKPAALLSCALLALSLGCASPSVESVEVNDAPDGIAAPGGCPPPAQRCVGRFGDACFTPVDGETCWDGLVCPFAHQGCNGPHGSACFRTVDAHCTDGLVCPHGLRACIGAEAARCYDPARGETCDAPETQS